MNDTLKVLETRRSCRNFKPDMIPEETLEQIVRAGTYAPTGMGKQSPIILAVTNKELRDQFSEENRKIMGAPVGMDPFYGAPVILVVLANKAVPTHVYDGSLVMGKLMNAAERPAWQASGSTGRKRSSNLISAKKFLLILVFRANTKGSATAHSDMQQSRQKRRPQEKRTMYIM